MRCLALVILLATAAPASEPGKVPGDGHGPRLAGEGLDALLDEALRAQREDLEAWHDHAFDRRVTRQKLDSDGRVTEQEVLEFHLSPIEGGFDEVLVAVDGETPPPRLVEEHRQAARFTERWRAAMGACEEEIAGECPDEPAARDASSYGVQVPLAGRDFVHEGRETVDGVPCHRLRLLELEPPPGAGARERVGAATVGTLWLSQEGAHIVRAELSLADPVKIFGGLSRLAGLDIVVKTQPLPGGLRPPFRITVVSDLRILGWPVRKRNIFVYSNFEKFRPQTAGRWRGREGGRGLSASRAGPASSAAGSPARPGRCRGCD